MHQRHCLKLPLQRLPLREATAIYVAKWSRLPRKVGPKLLETLNTYILLQITHTGPNTSSKLCATAS